MKCQKCGKDYTILFSADGQNWKCASCCDKNVEWIVLGFSVAILLGILLALWT